MVRKKDKERRESGWLSRNEMCRVFDVTVAAFDRQIRILAPANAIRKSPLAFYCRAIVEAWADRHGTVRVATAESDPLLSGGSSPALEDYRRQKAELAKLDLAERRREMVNLIEFRDLHYRLARNLRKAGEQLQRQCGKEAWALLDEALVANERELDAYFESVSDRMPDELTRQAQKLCSTRATMQC